MEDSVHTRALSYIVDDTDRDAVRSIYAQSLSRKILHQWQMKGIPPGGASFMQALIALSSGGVVADYTSMYIFLFDMLILSTIQQ